MRLIRSRAVATPIAALAAAAILAACTDNSAGDDAAAGELRHGWSPGGGRLGRQVFH